MIKLFELFVFLQKEKVELKDQETEIDECKPFGNDSFPANSQENCINDAHNEVDKDCGKSEGNNDVFKKV